MRTERDPRLLSAEQLETILASVETPKLVDAGMDEIEARYGSAELGLLMHIKAQDGQIARLTAAADALISFGPPVARLNDNNYICLQCGAHLANWKPIKEGVHAPDCAWDGLRAALPASGGE